MTLVLLIFNHFFLLGGVIFDGERIHEIAGICLTFFSEQIYAPPPSTRRVYNTDKYRKFSGLFDPICGLKTDRSYIKQESPAKVFYCILREVFKKTFFTGHFLTTASVRKYAGSDET